MHDQRGALASGPEVPRQKARHRRGLRPTRQRHSKQPSRLVDDHEFGVLIDDLQPPVATAYRTVSDAGTPGPINPETDPVSRGEPVRGEPHMHFLIVEKNLAALEGPGCASSGTQPCRRRQKHVQPHTDLPVCHHPWPLFDATLLLFTLQRRQSFTERGQSS